MLIKTERLIIEPLTFDDFSLLKEIDSETREAMNGLYASRPKGSDFFWYAYWKISLKSDNNRVGGFCFMSEPNEDGTVETGYGIDEKYQGNGFMTEALTAMISFAKEKSVKTVVAETEKDNSASQNVLKKCRFVFSENSEDGNLRFILQIL